MKSRHAKHAVALRDAIDAHARAATGSSRAAVHVAALSRKIREAPASVDDDDVRLVAEELGDDATFELIVINAFAAGHERLEAALRAAECD